MTTTTPTATGPLVPAGEPRPGPLLPPEQPQAPEPAPEPPSEPTPTEAALRLDRTPDDEPMRDDYPLTVHEAIAEVTRRVKGIAKDKQTTGGERFFFRGIDDALAALHPIFGDVGLVLLPGEVVRESWETRATSRGGTLNVARLLVRYTLVGPDGSWLPGEAWGEAGDSGDKATQKAHSQSYKTFVFQTFSIPTEASAADEPDATHEPAAPHTPEQRARAAAAWGAAKLAEGMPQLAAVRHAAIGEGLLGVPVSMPDGDRALGVLLDERRAEVERAATAQGPAQ